MLKISQYRRFFPEPGFRYFDSPSDSLGGDAVPTLIQLTLTRQDEFIHKQKDVQAITIRTCEGELGILAGHEYTIEQLSPGILDIDVEGDNKERWAISGGFAHVNDNGVVDINAVEAIPLKEIDADKLSRAIELAKQQLNDPDPMVKAHAEIALELFEPIEVALKANN
jgi:F-type H+-transporting ATPase subunit delta